MVHLLKSPGTAEGDDLVSVDSPLWGVEVSVLGIPRTLLEGRAMACGRPGSGAGGSTCQGLKCERGFGKDKHQFGDCFYPFLSV